MSHNAKKLKNEKFYSLLAIAYSVCMDLGEDDARVEQYLHYLYDLFRDFNFDFTGEVKAELIPMKSWKQIDMPCDMVDAVRVGFKDGNLIRVFTMDPNMGKLFEETDDSQGKVRHQYKENEAPRLSIANLNPEYIPLMIYNGGDYYNIQQYYGALVNHNYLGYFSFDWKERVINFKDTVSGYDHVYLEYISDGINYSGATVAHPYVFSALKAGVHWKRSLFDSRISAGQARELERIYNNEKHTAQLRLMNFNLDDFREAMRAGFKLVVKN
jgi:hypothetical protein